MGVVVRVCVCVVPCGLSCGNHLPTVDVSSRNPQPTNANTPADDRCWAGIGLSANGTMGDASVFLIGQLSNGTASVGLYQVADDPYGPAPPVVR